MTTNHPAHGPVSLDRLHQIREILSKASAQSDGGNLGYAMADAVKVIDGAIAEFGVEPQRNPVLAYADSYRDMAKRGVESIPVWSVITDLERNIAPLYTAPTAQVVPTFDEWLAIRGNKPLGWVKDAMRESYDACRAAMLQAGNSPVAPDGWIPVSERMPGRSGVYMVWNGKHIGAVSLFFGSFQCIKPEQITHWRH
ncbi:hypothetical protein ACT8NB_004499, partial [Escherichia coli]